MMLDNGPLKGYCISEAWLDVHWPLQLKTKSKPLVQLTYHSCNLTVGRYWPTSWDSFMLLMQQRRWQDTPNPNTSNSRSNLSSNLSSSRPQIPTSAPDAPLQKSMSNPRHRSLPPPKSRIRIFRRTGIGSRDTNDAIRGLLSYTWKMDGIGIGRTESIDGKGEGGGE